MQPIVRNTTDSQYMQNKMYELRQGEVDATGGHLFCYAGMENRTNA
jgi:hypothetical protein